MVEVSEVKQVDDELVDAVAVLLPQLSSSAVVPSRADLEDLVGSAASTLLVARDPDDGSLLGILTLALFRIPTGVRAWIEDVVTDGDARGRGVGTALTERALQLASEGGARTVELTSRSSRVAANRLYQRLGFEIRETNIYRYRLD